MSYAMGHRYLNSVRMVYFASILGVSCSPGSSKERVVLDTWLMCHECSVGELDSVQAVAGRNPAVIDTLRVGLLHGPSLSRQDQLMHQLVVSYQKLARYAARESRVLPFDEAEYVRQYRDKFLLLYRSRAAQALGRVGGLRAREALDSALQLPPDSMPERLRSRIRFLRDSVLGP